MVVRFKKPSQVPDLVFQLKLAGWPPPRWKENGGELRFHPTRKWPFDLAWPALLLAVEVDGGVWVQGRHTRGQGVENDCEKYAEALCLGWRVLRVTSRQVKSGQALAWIDRLLRREGIHPRSLQRQEDLAL